MTFLLGISWESDATCHCWNNPSHDIGSLNLVCMLKQKPTEDNSGDKLLKERNSQPLCLHSLCPEFKINLLNTWWTVPSVWSPSEKKVSTFLLLMWPEPGDMLWGSSEVFSQWRPPPSPPSSGSTLSPVIDVWNLSCASHILHYCVCFWWMQALDPLSWRWLDAGVQLPVGWRLQVKSRTRTLWRLLPQPPLCLGCVRGCWVHQGLFFQLRGRKCLVTYLYTYGCTKFLALYIMLWLKYMLYSKNCKIHMSKIKAVNFIYVD